MSKVIKGYLIVERLNNKLDGNNWFDENATRESALVVLKELEGMYGRVYDIHGEYLLDGSITLRLISKHPHFNDLSFMFKPYSALVSESVTKLYELQQKTAV